MSDLLWIAPDDGGVSGDLIGALERLAYRVHAGKVLDGWSDRVGGSDVDVVVFHRVASANALNAMVARIKNELPSCPVVVAGPSAALRRELHDAATRCSDGLGPLVFCLERQILGGPRPSRRPGAKRDNVPKTERSERLRNRYALVSKNRLSEYFSRVSEVAR